jgi:ribosome-associated translation inhibitor RaiA
MRIILSGVGFRTSAPLRAYAEQRILSWIGHLEREIDIVTVQLASQRHGGGLRTQCRLLARTVGGECLVVEETSADVYEAIDGAPQRVARALDRARRKRRRPAHAGSH